MAGLSSNWKKLQLKLKADSPSKPSLKRKADDDGSSSTPTQTKKPKTSSTASKKQPRESVLGKLGGIGAGKVGVSTTTTTTKNKMGAAQSTIAKADQKHGIQPSASVWAASQGVSAEALAEAYQLGSRDASMVLSTASDKVNQGLAPGVEVGKYLAIDCEMVGVGAGGHESALARVSIVDFHGRQVYDSYVRPRERVTDWRTALSGVSPKEMRFARDFADVRREVGSLLEGRVLIGHDVRHDLEALAVTHPPRDVRDTVRHAGFRQHAHGRKPALRVLARELLDVEIQSGAHSSLEDARVTMLLFRRHKSEFDVDHANRYGTRPTGKAGSHTKKAKKKK